MIAAIAGYRTAILALLTDASMAIWSANDVDQALRWALAEYSFRRPLIRTYQYTVIGRTAFHDMPADFVTRQITRVQLWNSDDNKIVDLAYYAFYRDEQWVINTHYQINSGEILQVSYSTIHQVDGLDSAAGTTIPAAEETMLQLGAAGRAAQMRGLDRIETINMNLDVVSAYEALARDYLARFASMLALDPTIEISALDFPEIEF